MPQMVLKVLPHKATENTKKNLSSVWVVVGNEVRFPQSYEEHKEKPWCPLCLGGIF